MATTLGGATPGVINAILGKLSVFGLVLFVAVERHAHAPLVQLALLRNRVLTMGLLSMTLIATIMMATLVVGPFYLSGVLGLSPVQTGLAMSVGPVVSDVAGVPAGRLVDPYGEAAITYSGMIGVILGSVLMLLLPGLFGVTGYIGGLAIITASHAVFQAANNTAIMNTAPSERRGVTSALLGLSRNIGLITGASAMRAVFALGSKRTIFSGPSTGDEVGLQVTFAVAALLAVFALGLSFVGRRNT